MRKKVPVWLKTDLRRLDLADRIRNTATRCMPDKAGGKAKRLTRKEIRELDIKIVFIAEVVRRDPSYVEALEILGDHYTQRGRYDSSLKVDQALSQLEPKNPLVFYNLACSYSLNSELEPAAAALERALK